MRGTPKRLRGLLEAVMTCETGELAVQEAIARFQRDFMGTSAKEIRVRFLDDLVVVRLDGILTPAQQRLLQTMGGGPGRDMIKSIRTQLIEAASAEMSRLVGDMTGSRVLSFHHDISTRTGEEVLLFKLSGPPRVG